ncbi:hypothetical protein [Paracoccus sp. KR1-242]|uniref:hypothetical protein n=1 Tax=Paracoccus sp. KR1-242 TaxID=3410028 RepID=UPI003C0942F8
MGIDPVTAAIGGSVASGLMGSSASKKAASAQTDANDKALALQREMYDQTRSDLGGYRDAGGVGLQALMYELGLGPAPRVGGQAPRIETITTPGTSSGGPSLLDRLRAGATGNQDTRDYYLNRNPDTTTPGRTQYRVGGQTFNTLEEAQAWARSNPTGSSAYRGFEETPGYKFQFDQGTKAVNALAGARGGLNSGRTMEELTEFGHGLASTEHGNYLNRLTGLAGLGQNSAAMTGTAGQNFANSAGNLLSSSGSALADSYINSASSFNNGLNNALGAWRYQSGLGKTG